jgi:hypothetical protein
MKRPRYQLTDLQRQILKDRNENLELFFLTQLMRNGFPVPVRQYQFALPRKWAFDLAYLELKIGIEIHGGVDTRGYGLRGRHVRGRGFEEDRRKLNEAVARGWRVLEFTRTMLEPRPVESEALTMLRRVLEG